MMFTNPRYNAPAPADYSSSSVENDAFHHKAAEVRVLEFPGEPAYQGTTAGQRSSRFRQIAVLMSELDE